MKAIVAIFVFWAALISCDKESSPNTPQNKILLLKIDYLTYQFEGGVEQNLSSTFAPFDSLPITNVFISPGDFGNLKLYYQPNNELLFDGDIVWMGWGPINYPPALLPPSSFAQISVPLPQPDTARFQYVFPQWMPQKLPLDSIWMNVADLQIVKEYTSSPKDIGFFLYTPSVGMGDPADWDWILFLNKVD